MPERRPTFQQDQNQGVCMSRIRESLTSSGVERGSIANWLSLVAGCGAFALGAAVVVGANTGVRTETVEKDTEATVKELDIRMRDVKDLATVTADLSGTTYADQKVAQMPVINGGKPFGVPGTARLAVAEQLIAISDISAASSAFTEVQTDAVDAKTGKRKVVVKVDVSQLTFETLFEPTTKNIISKDPGATDAVDTLISVPLTGVELVCDIFGIERCEDINKPRDLTEAQKAEARKKLELFALASTKECAIQNWKTHQLALNDAILTWTIDDNDIKPEDAMRLVSVEYVDENGRPFTGTPDYSLDARQDLIDDGVIVRDTGLQDEIQTVAKANVKCIPADYEPVFASPEEQTP